LSRSFAIVSAGSLVLELCSPIRVAGQSIDSRFQAAGAL